MKSTQSDLARSHLLPVFALVFSALLAGGCGEAPQPPEQAPARPVKMMTVGVRPAGITLEYPGEIAATRSVNMGFEVAGKIIDLPIEDGLRMQQGDLLARLDPSDYEAARDAAQATLRATRSAYRRAKNIFDEGAGSQAEVDKTLRDLKVAEQELKKAQKALDDTELRAPYDGVVGQRLADNYQNVQAKEPVLIYQDTSRLEMDVSVPERDFVRMQQGLTLEERTQAYQPEVAVSSIPGRTFPARIKSFTTTADPVTRTYTATFQFERPDDVNILPGMTARVILTPSAEVIDRLQAQDTVMVPLTAVGGDAQGDPYVWRIDPDSMAVSRVPVKLGAIRDARIEVTAGLEQGDRIAVSGVARLYEGARVRPLEK
jgi:RND family efflux transporter MFP subunit